jgi:hypothetical protein
MTFRIGQKVAQIAPWKSNDTAFSDVSFTQCGVVYTVREISEVRGVVSLLFFELRNPIHKYRNLPPMEQVFPAWNFRPIIERKTDITVFTEILRKTNIGVDA